LRAIAATLHS